MGRFSWLTEGSSSSDQLATRSSARVVSKDEEDVSSHTSRDISYGIPSRCYCGSLTPLKMMDHTDKHPGRIGDFVVSAEYTTAVSTDYTTRCLRRLHNPLSPPLTEPAAAGFQIFVGVRRWDFANNRMSKPTFPRRFYTKGGDPDAGKSISRCSKNTKLFDSLRKLLTDDEWNEISDSRIGIFLKFRDLQFEWASRIAHAMLCFQVVCKKKYEIWSAVGANPIRFSLHEFSAITGLNCEYVENLETPDAPATDAVCEFWERLGVNVEVGPSIDQLAEACEWAGEWPREDKLRLGYLAIYAGFIQARRSAAETPVKLARLVLDLEKFEEYPWGRVCFLQLIKSIKGVDLEKSGYVLEGFIEVLQIWAFESMPNFAEKYGAPLPSKPSPPLLAYKGIQGKRYIAEAMLKQVVFKNCELVDREEVYPRWDDDVEDLYVDNIIKAIYGELGGRWRWKPSDWDEEGVLVSNHPRVDVKPPIKVEASFTDSKKRPRPTPPSNYDDIEETIAELLVERSVKQLMDVRLQEQRRSDDPSPKKDETGAGEDVTGAKEAKTAQPVSTDPSPKSPNSSKVQDKRKVQVKRKVQLKPDQDRVLRPRKLKTK
ncbi:unnamed protein product [Microthlaspi erraticum]|uniref:DUF1985 domain-containing protein n=1 Tax=Microthlaspi erraticum TaxID=1685480 RepID=A0A6D2IT28_9BRAS|nr:unnamed protein product [Microthlaspi erraticum]